MGSRLRVYSEMIDGTATLSTQDSARLKLEELELQLELPHTVSYNK